jgi:hypothetical protein
MDDDKLEAIQNVVDRVSSYQDGAEDRVVADELRTGLTEADIDLDDAQVQRLASAIEAAEGEVRATDVLR